MRPMLQFPLLVGVLAVLITDCCFAEYPPNNAAVLYYRGFLHFAAPEGDRIEKLKAFVKGEATLDDDLDRYIRGNHRVIEHANTAATIAFCDWGLDYARGIGMLLPDLHHAGQVSDLLIANARRLMAQNDPQGGIRQGLAVHHMSRHIGNNVLLSYVFSLGWKARANKVIGDILSDWPANQTFLTELRHQLAIIESQQNHLSAALKNGIRSTLADLNRDPKAILLELLSDWCDPNTHPGIFETCRAADADFFDRNRQYYLDHMAKVDRALALSFSQAYPRLSALQETLDLERFTRDDAIFAASYYPSVTRSYCADIRAQTYFNLMKTAIELYQINLRTGRLPDALSPEMPKNLFTNGAFTYEKTDEGFLLSFDAIDPGREKTYSYTFKVR